MEQGNRKFVSLEIANKFQLKPGSSVTKSGSVTLDGDLRSLVLVHTVLVGAVTGGYNVIHSDKMYMNTTQYRYYLYSDN